jgi:hypothetical protein
LISRTNPIKNRNSAREAHRQGDKTEDDRPRDGDRRPCRLVTDLFDDANGGVGDLRRPVAIGGCVRIGSGGSAMAAQPIGQRSLVAWSAGSDAR